MLTAVIIIPLFAGLLLIEPTILPGPGKRLAKAELRKNQPNLPNLLQARRRKVHDEYQARLNEFKNGRGTQRFLLNAAARLRDARQAVAKDQAERIRDLETYWIAIWCIEQTDKRHFENGRLSISDYAEVPDLRLQAEMDLRDARSNLREERSPVPFTPDRFGIFRGEVAPIKEALFFSKTFARATHSAQRTDYKDLARQRVASAWTAFWPRQKEFLVGRGTLHFLNEALARDIEAQLAAAENDTARVAIYEAHWMISKQNEQIVQYRFDNGRVALQDLMDARHTRLDVESAYVRAWKERESRESSASARLNELVRLEENDPLGFRELAKAELKALHKNPKARLAEALKAAQMDYRKREEEFLAGRGTLSFLIDSTRWLGDAELAATDEPAERLSVLERSWRRFQRIEDINRQRYAEDKIASHDLDQAIYWRLDAQIRLVQAQGGAAAK